MSLNNFSFKIPIPPSLKKNNVPQHQIESSYLDGNSASHSWKTNADHSLGRNPRPFLQPSESYQTSYCQSFKPDSTMGIYNFNRQAIISSTPLVRGPEISQKRNLLSAQPPPPPVWATSPMSLPGYSTARGTESINSWIHGTSSVRSMTSDTTDFSVVMLRAFNLYVERNLIPTDMKNKLSEVVNGMRGLLGEAIQDLGVEGSIRSHYSKYASSVKSGFSKASDRSHDAMSILLRSSNTASMSRTQVNIDKEHCRSILCSIKRPDKAAVGNDVKLTVDTVDRAVPNLKRPRSGDGDESGEDDVIAPSTVKRKLIMDAAIDDGIVECDSSTEKLRKRNVTLRRGQMEMRKAKAESNKKRKSNLTSTPVTSNAILKTVANSKQRSAPKPKADLKASPPVVTCTRSGRNVKKTSFYQVPRPTKQAGAELNGRPAKNVAPLRSQSSDPMNVEKITNGKKEKAINRKKPALNIEPEEKSPIIFHTRSGRAVKMMQDYNDVSISKGSTKENADPKAKKKATQKERNGSKKTIQKADTKVKNPPISSAPQNDLFGDISFGGDDIFIPEVTESTRRGVSRVKGLKHLGEQTPPLHHFTANLNRKFVNGATPSQTPEWLLSQRTGSEVKKLQKRKQAQKKVKPAAKGIATKQTKQKKKLTKEEAAVIGLIRGDRANIPLGMEVVARPRCSDSEASENDD